jgi:inosine-uridine nucleoside N-ribohydrolase
MTTRPRIVLDCDPGVDDMFAIFTALRFCELAAVTTVAGNVGIEHTTRNALAILELAGADCPVHQGASQARAGRAPADASDIHGQAGLGGVVLPTPTTSIASTDAVSALLEATGDGETTVVAVGPLTNIAAAIDQDPGWASRLPRLVIMGGSTDSGNVGPYAEFNIWADPEAAAVVFSSGVPLAMAGLNLTRQVGFGAEEIERLRTAGTPTSLVAADALDFYSDVALQRTGNKESAMHDPCAVLEVAAPDMFERRSMRVHVETVGEHTRGMTVCDQRPGAAEGKVAVLTQADRSRAVEVIVSATVAPLG